MPAPGRRTARSAGPAPRRCPRRLAYLLPALAVHTLFEQLLETLQQLLELVETELAPHLAFDPALRLRRRLLHPAHTRLLGQLLELLAAERPALHQALGELAQLVADLLLELLHCFAELLLLLLVELVLAALAGHRLHRRRTDREKQRKQSVEGRESGCSLTSVVRSAERNSRSSTPSASSAHTVRACQRNAHAEP